MPVRNMRLLAVLFALLSVSSRADDPAADRGGGRAFEPDDLAIDPIDEREQTLEPDDEPKLVLSPSPSHDRAAAALHELDEVDGRVRRLQTTVVVVGPRRLVIAGPRPPAPTLAPTSDPTAAPTQSPTFVVDAPVDCPDACGDSCTGFVSAWGYCGTSFWHRFGGTDCTGCEECPEGACTDRNGNLCVEWMSQWGWCGTTHWHRSGTDCRGCDDETCPETCPMERGWCCDWVSIWGYCGDTYWHQMDGTDCRTCDGCSGSDPTPEA